MGWFHLHNFVPEMGTDRCMTPGNRLTSLSLGILPQGLKKLFACLRGSCDK